MTRALVACALGVVTVDLETEEIELDATSEEMPDRPALELGLPLVVAADQHGSTIVAVLDRRPPLVVSGDGGLTWRDAGAGLPPGRDVAISPDHPDHVLYASESRIFVSHDGGRFWAGLGVELTGIVRLGWSTD